MSGAERKMKKEDVPLELSLEEIREFKKRLSLDDFELQLLMHRMRTPIETLKRRYARALSDTERSLIEIAIKYKEEVMKNGK